MIGKALDAVYRAAGALAGAFLVAILVLVVAQIGLRLVGRILPSADEFAGFCLAATSFLGLAQAFRSASHIRVTLFLQRAPAGLRRWLEALALALAAAVVCVFAWYTLSMLWTSWARGEVTSGLVPLPLWLPQLGMGLGAALMALAVVEDLVRALLGRETSYAAAEAAGEIGE